MLTSIATPNLERVSDPLCKRLYVSCGRPGGLTPSAACLVGHLHGSLSMRGGGDKELTSVRVRGLDVAQIGTGSSWLQVLGGARPCPAPMGQATNWAMGPVSI